MLRVRDLLPTSLGQAAAVGGVGDGLTDQVFNVAAWARWDCMTPAVAADTAGQRLLLHLPALLGAQPLTAGSYCQSESNRNVARHTSRDANVGRVGNPSPQTIGR